MRTSNRFLLSVVLGSMFIAGSASAEKGVVIASLTVGGGFVPNWFEETKIYTNGDVTFRNDSHTEEYVVANLGPDVVENVIAVTKDVRQADLEDINPELPQCADAPTYTYHLVKKGAKVKTKQRINCKDYINPTAYSMDSVHSLLDGFIGLSH